MDRTQVALDGASLIARKAVAEGVGAAHALLDEEQFAIAAAELTLVLQIAQQQFERGVEPAVAMDRMVRSLHRTRSSVAPAVWQALVPIVQNHAVAAYFHQDPFTRWSFDKPRGYSGDAQLLDFIYRHPNVAPLVESASEIGRALYDYSRHAPSCVAVRERRDILTAYVDEIAAGAGGTEVLTIAAGHLREAHGSAALREGRIKRWVALDQDPVSVESIARDFAGMPVQAAGGSVRGLMSNAYDLGQFDFVYSAGLYDYLLKKIAVRLTRTCMQMLKPGGTLLFANFSPELGDDGYMETFMDWMLLLRSEADMWAIVNASVDRNQVDAKVFFGANRNIVYAVIRKLD